MSTSIDWVRFATVYNDVTQFPHMADVAASLGLSYQTVRNYAATLRRLRKSDATLPELVARNASKNQIEAGIQGREITTILPDYAEPIEDLIARATKINQDYAAYHQAKHVIDVKIKVPGPFAVVGLPDHHLNNLGTNLARALADAEFIAQHPALFAVGIGDWLDNFIVGRLERERRKDIMSHSDAWRLLEYYVTLLAPKLVAAISGNHMDWSTEAGGVDVTKKLFEGFGLGAIYDTDEVRVRLTTPDGAQFTHLARHKYKGMSRFNPMHSIAVHILERWEGEDVIWGGHIHQAGHVTYEKRWMGESKAVHGVQLGAYKTIDGYARREHFRPQQPFLTPLTIHDPANGRTIFFDDMYEGVKHLDLLRKERGLS